MERSSNYSITVLRLVSAVMLCLALSSAVAAQPVSSDTDAAASLQGRFAGVQILNTSGAPGSSAIIRVRGYTYAPGEDPLVIVDGLRVEDLGYLDPSLIESVQILKDASSAALYGAEGADGVILITTKNGEGDGGAPHVGYDFRLVGQSLRKRPEMFGTREYIDYQTYIGQLDRTTLDAVWDGQEHDWFDEVFAPAWSQQHSLTFSGGNGRGHFFASLGYVDDDGIVRGDKDTYKRLSAQINADYRLFDWLRVASNTSFEKWETRSVSSAAYGSMMHSVMSIDPLTPAYYSSIDQFPSEVIAKYDENPDLIYRDPGHGNDFYAFSKYLTEATGNPLFQRDRIDASSGGINVRGTLSVELTTFEGFTFASRLGYRISQDSSHSFSKPYWINSFSNSQDYSISADVNTGYYYRWENFAGYGRSFGRHSVEAAAGLVLTGASFDNASIASSGPDILQAYDSPFQYISYLLSDAYKDVSNRPVRAGRLSYFARLGYGYDGRYGLSAAFRSDAPGSYASLGHGVYSYSLSGSWNIAGESFVGDNISTDLLSALKFRASWGRISDIDFDYILATETLPAASLEALAASATTQLDLGLDAGLFDSRLSIAMDWYRKVSSYEPCEVLNIGLEFGLGWQDSIGEFSYGVSANLSTLHNEVLSLGGGAGRIVSGGIPGSNNSIRSVAEAGYPLWYFKGYSYAGVDESTGAALYHDAAGGTTLYPGESDMQYIGKSIPDLSYGISINLAWNGFDFNVLGTGTAGSDIVSLLYSADRPRTNTFARYYRDSWTPDRRGAAYPDMRHVATDWKFWSSSAAVFDGSYFKFKQIQFGYTLPADLTEKALISNLRFFVSLDDFFTLGRYPGFDPETATAGTGSSAGYDIGSYPLSRKAVLGVSLRF